MAYVNSNRIASNGLADRLASFVKAAKSALNQRAVYQNTLRELNALNDRELSDLGIHRELISDVAREAAYGK